MKLTSSNKHGLGWVGLGRIASVDEVTNQVASEPHSIGTSIVGDYAIPQPWCGQFLCASRGCTQTVEGAYYRDWEKLSANGNMKWPTWNSTGVHVNQMRVNST